MRRRVTGATLTILGVLVLLFEPVGGSGGCAASGGGCREYSARSWSRLIHWPPEWDKLFLPMLIIGVALVVTAIVLLFKARRSTVSSGAAR